MSTRHDVEIDVPVGTISRTEGRMLDDTFSFRNEADCRDHVAGMLWLLGWNVSIEVPVSTGGRCDVVASTPDDSFLLAIEIKRELTTQRAARRAFQQVDGYHRHFTNDAVATRRHVSSVLLVVNIDHEVVRPFYSLYHDIECQGYWSFVRYVEALSQPADEWRARLGVFRRGALHQAMKRQRAAQAIAEQSADAVTVLAERARREHLHRLNRNYPAMAEFLAAHIGVTLKERAA